MEARNFDYRAMPNSRSVSWGAIWAGVFVAMFTQLLLGSLALALGLASIEPGISLSAQGISFNTGAWLLAITIISIFAGSFTAGRLANYNAKFDGVIHGIVTVSFLVILSIFLTTVGISNVIGGTFTQAIQVAKIQQMQQIIPAVKNQQAGTQGQQGAQFSASEQQKIAAQVHSVATKAAWLTFLLGFIALITAIIGGHIGRVARMRQLIPQTS